MVLRLTPISAFFAAAAYVAWRDYGSTAAPDWLPLAVAVGLVTAAVLLSGSAFAPGRVVTAGALGLCALAGWTAISLDWSPLPSLARDEALLTALYALAVCTPALTLAGPTARRAAVAVAVAVLGGLAVATELRLRYDGTPVNLFAYGRLAFPVSYANADAAFFLVGFWPAIALAARRSWPVAARGAAFAAATSLLAGWLLTQSKGGAFALVVSAVVFFALCPSRLRALGPTLIAALLVGVAFRPLTAPYRASADGLAASIRHAGTLAVLVTAAAAVIGVGYALVDRKVVLSRRVHRVVGVVAGAALLAGLGGGAAAFAVSVERPGHWLAERWHSFKTAPEIAGQTGSTHLFSLGSNRFDFWRVAAREFEDNPVAGIGGGGFRSAYLETGRSVETPERAHSVELDVLSETGLVGFALLLVGIGAPLALVLRRARGSLTTAALAGGAAYWLTHATVDWIWTFPAVTVPALVLLGIGAAPEQPRRLRTGFALPAGVAAAAVALVAFAPPWLSAKYSDRAYSDAPSRVAFDLRWARRLDPLSTEPYEAQAELARSPADIPPLQAAVRKEPRQVDLRFALGMAYLRAHEKTAARRELHAALELYPRSFDIQQALRQAG